MLGKNAGGGGYQQGSREGRLGVGPGGPVHPEAQAHVKWAQATGHEAERGWLDASTPRQLAEFSLSGWSRCPFRPGQPRAACCVSYTTAWGDGDVLVRLSLLLLFLNLDLGRGRLAVRQHWRSMWQCQVSKWADACRIHRKLEHNAPGVRSQVPGSKICRIICFKMWFIVALHFLEQRHKVLR
jgi:hypothetical protein